MKIDKEQYRPLYLAGFRKSWLLALSASLPGLLATVALIITNDYDVLESTTLLSAVFIPWLMIISIYYRSALRPWQAVANILIAFREQDYTIRSRATGSDDVVDVVLNELNLIADHLSSNRITIFETQKLLGRILAEVDIAIFLFDPNQRLVMANRFASNLFEGKPEDLVGKTIDALNLTFAHRAAHTSVHEQQFPKRHGRWLVKHSVYRQQGTQHQFIMLADIGQSLREEELEAWRRLVRILSHEINNALTPLKTTTGSMARIIRRTDSLPDWREDFQEGLNIIDKRINQLDNMVNSYAQMARLPEPSKQPASIRKLLQGIVTTYHDKGVYLASAEDFFIHVDTGQIEQVLINLIKNALEAAIENTQVTIKYSCRQNIANIIIEDNGSGIKNLDNLFVPYYSTKTKGSGIGLVISRQIVEAHGGRLQLLNRDDISGCQAIINLPLD